MGLEQIAARVHRFTDVANTYVITAGDRALLIDSGAGEVLEALPALGVTRVEWVLHTHHHRDQCLGDLTLRAHGASIAAPAAEAHLLEDADGYWQRYSPYDRYDGASNDNCLTVDVPLERRLADYETFTWADLEFLVLPTPGHTRGSVTYLVEIDGCSYAFSGDLIAAPGRVWTLHDLEWWYSHGEGARVVAHSARLLRQARPDRLAPSHGAVMDEAEPALGELERNLVRFVAAADRGWTTEVGPVPLAPEGRFVRVTEHLLAVVGTCSHFYVLLSESGEALFFDYGLASDYHLWARYRFGEHSLQELRQRFGVPPPSVLIATHYHDDHVCGAPYLQRRYGTEIWAAPPVADILERPSAYKLPCVARTPVSVDRRLPLAEPIEWNEYSFIVQHNPGHTWYASSILFTVDGVRVAAMGDEIAVDSDGNFWGNVPVWRNRVAPADYLASADVLSDFDPQILLTGHKGPLESTPARLETLRTWARELDAACRVLASADNSGFAWDPGFATTYPFQLGADGGEFRVEVRNHFAQPAVVTVSPVLPDGWSVAPGDRSLQVDAGALAVAEFRLSPPTVRRACCRDVIPIEVTVAGRRFGQVAEVLVSAA